MILVVITSSEEVNAMINSRSISLVRLFPQKIKQSVMATLKNPNFDTVLFDLGSSDGKASAYNVGDPDLIPVSGRFSGEGNGNPLQHSCLENPMDGGALWATVCGVAKSRTRLRDFTYFSTC